MRHLNELRKSDSLLHLSETLRQTPSAAAPSLLEYACSERGLRAVNQTPEQMQASLVQWLRYTIAARPLTMQSLALLPMRLSSPSDDVSEQLEREVAEQNRKGIMEQTNTVMQEVVDEERRQESSERRRGPSS